MQITFLGTSSGVPTRERNVSATAVTYGRGRSWILVDCGEATQHQLAKSHLSGAKLSAILITHMHGDHCYGLPGLLASLGMQGRVRPLHLVGPPELKPYIEATIAHTALYLPFALQFHRVNDFDNTILGPVVDITQAPLSHRVPCFAYAISEKMRKRRLNENALIANGLTPGPEWGRLQAGEDIVDERGRLFLAREFTRVDVSLKKVIVAGDNDDPGKLDPLIENALLLVHEATYTEKQLQKTGPEVQHCSAMRIARYASASSVKNLALTHFSARYSPQGKGDNSLLLLEREAKDNYEGNLFLAEDFLTLTIADDASVTAHHR